MKIQELMNYGGNVTFTISAKELQEVIDYTVTSTRKELEKIIIDENSEVYLSPKQVSNMLGVNPSTLWRWHKRGYLEHIEMGGKRRYLKSEVKSKCLNKSNIYSNNQNLIGL